MILRRADTKDLDSISHMMGSLGHATAPGQCRQTIEGLLADPATETVLVSDGNGSVIALMCLQQGRQKGNERSDVTIRELMVHPCHHDRGIAQKLLDFAEQYCRATGANLIHRQVSQA